jgi:hypothetical protein
MNYKNRKKIQVLISEETYTKLNKLIGAEAIESGTKLPSISSWCRTLIEDTINFEYNKKKIQNFKYKDNLDKL